MITVPSQMPIAPRRGRGRPEDSGRLDRLTSTQRDRLREWMLDRRLSWNGIAANFRATFGVKVSITSLWRYWSKNVLPTRHPRRRIDFVLERVVRLRKNGRVIASAVESVTPLKRDGKNITRDELLALIEAGKE